MSTEHKSNRHNREPHKKTYQWGLQGLVGKYTIDCEHPLSTVSFNWTQQPFLPSCNAGADRAVITDYSHRNKKIVGTIETAV